MNSQTSKKKFELYRPHPWHGIHNGFQSHTKIVKAYIEITPNELIKYEICKQTGYLKVDRPQRYSSLPMTLYGFIPQTYSAEKVASLSVQVHSQPQPRPQNQNNFNPSSPSSKENSQLIMKGDGDPLDICVLSELPIQRSDIIMDVRILGGLKLIDSNEVDDKIIAVLNCDTFFDGINDISQINPTTLNRIKHYFLSYKTLPGEPAKTKIESVYNAESACEVIQAGINDYQTHFQLESSQ